MKALILGLAGAGLLALLPFDASQAHGGKTRVSVGFGFGYPGYYYRPYRYYGGYYPRSYVGFSVWPRYRGRAVRREDRGEIRNRQLFVYPAAGQSDAQLAEDRYQCHVWAADVSDYDPTLGAGSRAEAERYGRAFTACMEGRDYVVK